MRRRALTWCRFLAAAMVLALAAVAPRLAPGSGTAGAVRLPTSGIYMAIDCDVAATGIQSQCTLPSFPATSALTVGIVIANASGADSTLAAFNFEVYDPDISVLRPHTPVVNSALLPPVDFPCSSPLPAASPPTPAAPAAPAATPAASGIITAPSTGTGSGGDAANGRWLLAALVLAGTLLVGTGAVLRSVRQTN